MPEEVLLVRGARVHNLKNVTIALPHNRMTVVTGVSGSGKSSLVFDTIYAEGQRRYVESLSAYARQFLERMEKPAVDEIAGIAPPIAIRQKNTTRNPRSTVATATEIYDYLRVLFARAGRTYCPRCHERVIKDSPDTIAAAMLAEPEGSRWLVLFPVSPGESSSAGALRDRLFELRARGFNRLYQNGRVFEFSTPESLLEIDFRRPLFALADRLVIRPDAQGRLVDSVEICYRETGEVIFEPAGAPDLTPRRFAEKFACKRCNLALEEPEPRLFSFNNPYGACPRCQGFGNTIDYDINLIVPNPALSIREGAIDPWQKPAYEWFQQEFELRAKGKVRLDVPFADLTEEELDCVWNGSGRLRGLRQFFAEVEQKKYKVHVRVFLSRYRGYAICPACHGARLRQEALNVRVGGKNLAEVVQMNIAAALRFFDALTLSPEEAQIAEKVLTEIRQRLRFLNDVGLDYLTLDRLSSTLSGGEAQRIQLATCLGSRLVGALYVLDEPSIGLHARDTRRLIHILEELRELGNTILVVEHDAEIMRAADHIVDLGPGAGEKGGAVVFEGSFQQLERQGESLTGRYLRGELRVAHTAARRPPDPSRMLRFFGARRHNLQNIDVEIPLGLMIAVTGVSGSGKSTLVHEVIYPSLAALHPGRAKTGEPEEDAEPAAPRLRCRAIEGGHLVKDIVMVDQSPIGRTPRSNPVTYLKAFDIIRTLFAACPEAQRRGYTAGHFSFNVPGGRCETCQGDGVVTVSMQFLADVELVCDECKGTRFKSGILDVRYRGLNIHEVLMLTVKEAIDFFAATPRLANRLRLLDEVGLGYLRLGQSATTLSGGEAQRVKLAGHLTQTDCDGVLFLFDEPTTGLHFDDIAKLLGALQRLVRSGGTVLVIEHNLDVILSADWVIDLGPEGGEQGGRIVVAGTPEQVAACAESHTGRYLKQAFERERVIQ